jgi:hypothetical protein
LNEAHFAMPRISESALADLVTLLSELRLAAGDFERADT